MSAAPFRDASRHDVAALKALNDPAVPAVNVIADAVWNRFVDGEALVRVVDAANGGGLDAMLVALQPGRDYGSLNYAWFQRKLPRFTYVDRIVIAPMRRGSGLGRAAYADLFARAPSDRPIVCEVNLDPPNDASLAFHGSLAFREIAVFDPEPGKRVAMLARRSDGGAEPSWRGPDDGCTIETVTSASAADLATAVRALLAELGSAARPGDDVARALVESGRVQALVARDAAGNVVAAITVAASASIYAGGAFGVIQEFYVSPALRSRRLGARLVAAARRLAKSQGWDRLEVGTPAAARFPRTQSFYRANGFSEIGPRLQIKIS